MQMINGTLTVKQHEVTFLKEHHLIKNDKVNFRGTLHPFKIEGEKK